MTWFPEQATGRLGTAPVGGAVDQAYIAHVTGSPEAIDDNQILTTTLITVGAQVGVAPEAQPDMPRNLTIDCGQADQDGDVTIHGTNVANEVISETLTMNGTTPVVGALAFKTVTSIDLPPYTNDGAEDVIVGVGDKIGLYHLLTHNTVIFAFNNLTLEGTAPTVVVDADELEKNVATLNTANDGNQIDIYYLA